MKTWNYVWENGRYSEMMGKLTKKEIKYYERQFGKLVVAWYGTYSDRPRIA